MANHSRPAGFGETRVRMARLFPHLERDRACGPVLASAQRLSAQRERPEAGDAPHRGIHWSANCTKRGTRCRYPGSVPPSS